MVKPTEGKDQLIESIKEVDIKAIGTIAIMIYRDMTVEKEQYTARVYREQEKNEWEPTNIVMKASCEWLLKFDIEKHTNLKYHEKKNRHDKILKVYYPEGKTWSFY